MRFGINSLNFTDTFLESDLPLFDKCRALGFDVLEVTPVDPDRFPARKVREAAARRPRFWFESRRRYFVKNHGRTYAWIVDLAWAICFGLWRIRRRLQRLPDTDPPHLWMDFVRFSFWERPRVELTPTESATIDAAAPAAAQSRC